MDTNVNKTNKRKKSKPKGIGYKVGLYLITASSIGLILGFIVPWAKIAGDDLLSQILGYLYSDVFWLSDYFFLLLIMLIIGVIIVLLRFFEEIELISGLKSSWIKYVLQHGLTVTSILLIFFSLYFLGIMIAFNKLTIMAEDITAILYTPAPMFLAVIGVFNLYLSLSNSKKEAKVIQYKTIKRKNKPVKKKVKKPVKGGGEYA